MREELPSGREAGSNSEERHLLTVFTEPHRLMAIPDGDGTIQHVDRAAAELVQTDESELEVACIAVLEMGVGVLTTFLTAVAEAVRIVIKPRSKSDPVVELTAATVPDAEPPRVQLRIPDDGPGIPPSEGEPVLIGEETASAHTSGIGSWLTRWIVERHGGAISISGDDSQASHLTLLYPVPFLTR